MESVEGRQHFLDLLGIHKGAVNRSLYHRRSHGIDADVRAGQLDGQVAGERMYAGIGGGVGSRGRGTDSLDGPKRAGLYDGAATTLLHGFGRRLRHEELAFEDGIEEPVVLGWIDLQEGLWIKDTCVIDQDVQATVEGKGTDLFTRHLPSAFGRESPIKTG